MISCETTRVIIYTQDFLFVFFKSNSIKFDPTNPAPPVTIIYFFIRAFIAWQCPTLPCLKTKYHWR